MYFCNGQGLEIIGHNSNTLCPISNTLCIFQDNVLSAMLISERGHGLLVIKNIIVCILLIYGKLEGPRDIQLGMLSVNDVQMLLQKFDPNLSDGGAIT